MIHKVGLLPTCNHQQVPFAYKMYTQADDIGWKQSNAFKKTFSNPVNIEFLGVWQVAQHKPPSKRHGSYLTCSQGYRELGWTYPSPSAFYDLKHCCKYL